MNVLLHFLINIFLAYLVNLGPADILLVGLGGILIDIDHIIYLIFISKSFSIKKMLLLHNKNYKSHSPGFYIFHTIEFIVLFIIIGYFMSNWIFLIAVGFLLHWIVDALDYLFFYRSLYPWIKYHSLAYILIRKPERIFVN